MEESCDGRDMPGWIEDFDWLWGLEARGRTKLRRKINKFVNSLMTTGSYYIRSNSGPGLHHDTSRIL